MDRPQPRNGQTGSKRSRPLGFHCPLSVRHVPLLLVALVGCRGPMTLFGYTTEPPFDPNIRTVYVPAFKITPLVTTAERGLDRDLTDALVKELSARKSPMRVTSDRSRADTELIGTITRVTKMVQNRNQQNLTREAEITIEAEVVWRDLRTGDVLTTPKTPAQRTPTAPPSTFDPSREPPLPPPPNDAIRPVSIVATGRVLPELGESNATANKSAVERLAHQIVNMMERDW